MEEEKPPILGTWNSVYALVMGTLLFFMVFFHLFTQYFK